MAKRPVFFAVGAAVVVEFNSKAREIALVSFARFLDQFNFRTAFSAGTDHDRGAVCVVGANVQTTIASQFLKPYPNVGLQVFHQVADVDRAVGVGQCSGNEQTTRHESSCRCGERGLRRYPRPIFATRGSPSEVAIVTNHR